MLLQSKFICSTPDMTSTSFDWRAWFIKGNETGDHAKYDPTKTYTAIYNPAYGNYDIYQLSN